MSTESKPIADVPGAAPAAPAAPPAATPGATTPPVASTAPAAPPSAAPAAPPAPNKAPPPVAAPAKGDPTAIANAKEDLEDAQEELSEMDKWIEGAKVERAKRVAKVDAAQATLDILQPPQTNADAIQSYLAQQKAILAARGEQIAKARDFQEKNGFKLSDLIPKRAPLDMAMARKTQRGTQRPGSK